MQRLKSRQGIKDRNAAYELVNEVLTNGTKVKDLEEGELKDFLFKKYRSNTQRKYTYIYEDNVYIFSKNKILITTYPLQIRRKDYVK